MNHNDRIKVYGNKRAILVPCGKCEQCVKKYQNDWFIRNWMELQRKKIAVFFTLTYNDESVNYGVDDKLSVCRNDVKTFLKRFREYRRKHGLSTDFSYYITSEYGPTTLRPHYHGLLHGITLEDFRKFAFEWHKQYGFTMESQISILDPSAQRRCRYVAKYCAKGDFENPFVQSNEVEKNFHLISKGLGNNYLSPAKLAYHLATDFPNKRDSDGKYSVGYLEEIRRRMFVHINGFDYSVPRYYKEQIFSKRASLQMAYQDYISAQLIDLYETKLATLQADKVAGSRCEAVYILHNHSILEEETARASARASLKQFYQRSKI